MSYLGGYSGYPVVTIFGPDEAVTMNANILDEMAGDRRREGKALQDE